MDLYSLKQQFMELGTSVAIATIKQLYPSFDRVKYKEACEIAGSVRWVRWHTKHGGLKTFRIGNAKNSPVYYSRQEIAALLEAERVLEAKLI